MPEALNALVRAVTPPPVAQAQAWIEGRVFPPEMPLLDLSQAVPGYPPAAELAARVAEAAREPATARYSEILGVPALRAALAGATGAACGGIVDASNVAITSGCNQAFCVAAMVIAGPGDEVVLPAPHYFNHAMWLRMLGVRAVAVPFADPATGAIDLDRVGASLSERTRGVVLVSPDNPTGAEWRGEDVDALHAMLARRGAWLVLDETYRDFRDPARPAHGLVRAGAHETGRFVQLYSFSKAYAMTGYRVGAIVAPAELVAQAEKILDCVAICPPRISQEAALFALRRLDAWREAKARLMRERLDALRRAFAERETGYELVSSGAYFAYLRHPFPGTPAVDVARRLADRHNVLCLPGSFFGAGQEDYLRLAFANVAAERVGELMARLEQSGPSEGAAGGRDEGRRRAR